MPSRDNSPMPSTARNHSPVITLNVWGRIVLALVYLGGVVLFLFLGIYLGFAIGGNAAQAEFDKPTEGIGLAPDLSGAILGVIKLAGGGILGLVGGLLAGLIAMALANWLVIAPLLRRVSWLTTQAQQE